MRLVGNGRWESVAYKGNGERMEERSERTTGEMSQEGNRREEDQNEEVRIYEGKAELS